MTTLLKTMTTNPNSYAAIKRAEMKASEGSSVGRACEGVTPDKLAGIVMYMGVRNTGLLEA